MMEERVKTLVLDVLRKHGFPAAEPALRNIPFSGRLGLAVSNVFQIARKAFPEAEKEELARRVEELAQLIAASLRDSGLFESVEVVKGYVNCFFDPAVYSRRLVSQVLSQGVQWASGKLPGGRVMIEYSQPNTHKAFHIGHVRNAVLGAVLVRCFRYAGRDTVAANYIGDIGAHVFKALWYLEKYEGGTKNAPHGTRARAAWLGEAYAKADTMLAESEDLKNEVWEVLKKLSAALAKYWRDDSIFEALAAEPVVRRIALKEEDLFENRPPVEVAAIMRKLMNASLALVDMVSGRESGESLQEAAQLAGELRAIANRPGFEDIWRREEEVIQIAERWARQDPALLTLWVETRAWSIEDFNRIYAELNVPFDDDAVFFESEVEREGVEIALELESKGIVTDSLGAKIVEIDKRLAERFGEPYRDKYRVMVLVRSDGASLYGAKDLALARRKFRDYNIDESIYVVAIDQKFYFEQLFQILRLMGFPQWEKCFHLPYELVMLPGGKMSSRKGKVVLYDDVMDELRERAIRAVREKNPLLSEEQKLAVARDVALGALVYGMVRVDTTKRINFDFDEVLDFDGRSAPYIQYACARASSILRKAAAEKIELPDEVRESDFRKELTVHEIDLLGLIGNLPSTVLKVVEDRKPIHLASYAYDLAEKFSEFYHQCPVLGADSEVRRNRLLIVKAARIALETAMMLLGIPSPEVM